MRGSGGLSCLGGSTGRRGLIRSRDLRGSSCLGCSRSWTGRRGWRGLSPLSCSTVWTSRTGLIGLRGLSSRNLRGWTSIRRLTGSRSLRGLCCLSCSRVWTGRRGLIGWRSLGGLKITYKWKSRNPQFWGQFSTQTPGPFLDPNFDTPRALHIVYYMYLQLYVSFHLFFTELYEFLWRKPG